MKRCLDRRLLTVLLGCLALAGCAAAVDSPLPLAAGRLGAEAEQCVPYARRISGIALYGDAYTWWTKAAPAYECGSAPRPGAVLVLANTKKMPHGHLAVVKKIVSAREIDVTHSNWGNDSRSRRIVYDSMRVRDISPANDWSQLRFWNDQEEVFGFPYAAKGFIYPK